MTIEINDIIYDFKDFLFKKVNLTEKFPSSSYAGSFLTKWISGAKEFELATSGSTSLPKLIPLKRKWLEISALQTISILNLWNEKILCCIPTYKIGGLMMIIRALAGGFSISIVEPESDPMKNISENHDFTFVSLVPYQLSQILEDESSTRKLNRFKTILIGGSGIHQTLLEKIKKLSPLVYHSYGMTETCSHIALKKLNQNPWPHFKLNPEVTIKINTEGLLQIKAYQTGNNWIQTNDLVKIINKDQFDVLGRADFIINTGSFKVVPELLESKIMKILSDAFIDSEMAISSINDEAFGEAIVLLLCPPIQIPKDQILPILKPHLEKYELPKKVVIMDEIPKNESGKTDRLKLKLFLNHHS